MTVVVKTPVCPLVIALPAIGAIGAWDIQVQKSGVRALFKASNGTLQYFALAGAACAEKQALSKQPPPVLA